MVGVAPRALCALFQADTAPQFPRRPVVLRLWLATAPAVETGDLFEGLEKAPFLLGPTLLLCLHPLPLGSRAGNG